MIKHVEYLDGFQYTGGELNFFPHAEGYVNVTLGTTGNRIFNYVYNYTDHLGNIRLSYTKDVVNNQLKILEENHYYPFGLKHQKYSSAGSIGLKAIDEVTARPANLTSTPYNYKFGAKEWQDELGLNMYDFGARGYDPTTGRTTTQDPLAEKYYSLSSYSFLGNNPNFFTDPTGMSLDPPPDFNGDTWTDDTGTYTKTDNYTYTQEGADGTTFEGYRTDAVQLETAEVTGSVENTSGDSLNPSTTGNNIGGTSYIGPNNPLTYNRKPSYEFAPSFLPEFPAIGHDRRYDNLKVAGIEGVLFDTRAIGADWVFVAEELAISSNPLVSTPERIVAGLSGGILGAAALPKTIFKLTSSGSAQGMTDIMKDFKTSNQGVTNKPGK